MNTYRIVMLNSTLIVENVAAIQTDEQGSLVLVGLPEDDRTEEVLTIINEREWRFAEVVPE